MTFLSTKTTLKLTSRIAAVVQNIQKQMLTHTQAHHLSDLLHCQQILKKKT